MKICKDCKHYSKTEDSDNNPTHYCGVHIVTHVDLITGNTWYEGRFFCTYMRNTDCGPEGKLFKKKHWWRFW